MLKSCIKTLIGHPVNEVFSFGAKVTADSSASFTSNIILYSRLRATIWQHTSVRLEYTEHTMCVFCTTLSVNGFCKQIYGTDHEGLLGMIWLGLPYWVSIEQFVGSYYQNCVQIDLEL